MNQLNRMPDKARLKYLFQQYLQNQVSDKELEELFDCIRESKQGDALRKQMLHVFRETQPDKAGERVDWDAMFSGIINNPNVEERRQNVRVKRLHLWRNIAAAVLVLVVGTAGIYLFLNRSTPAQSITQTEAVKQDIMPGGNKAVLTLSNGTKVILDSAYNGKLAGQGNMNVLKKSSGLLVYTRKDDLSAASKSSRQSVIQYNTLSTPRGGQYQLTLSDGTKVWLNAASSIHYPITFSGKNRPVEITGEVYFEVASNAEKPFIVRKGAIEVKVLGTHFNINAYDDEVALKVTLLEGLVKVSQLKTKHSKLVHAGQQAKLNKKGHIKIFENVPVNDVISWKNGFFSFREASIPTVMKQLQRWYNINVEYGEAYLDRYHFTGELSRNAPINKVLDMIEQTGVARFTINEHKITVLRGKPYDLSR